MTIAAMTKAERIAMLENGAKVTNQTIARLRAALLDARRELITMAEAGCQRLEDHGITADPPGRVYGPAVARIDAAIGGH